MKTATVVTPTTQGVFHFGQGGGGCRLFVDLIRMALPGEWFIYDQARRQDNPSARKAASLVNMDPGGKWVVVTPANLSMITISSTVGISSAFWGLGCLEPGVCGGSRRIDRPTVKGR